MPNYTTDYEFKQLNTKFIEIDRAYQRHTDSREVAKILKNFDPRVVNVIKVSYRDGHYYCFDGGHTIAALKAKNGGRDLMVDCKVFYGLTQLDEKELFKKQTGVSRRVEFREKLRADFKMGDPVVMRFIRLTESCGVTVSFDSCKGTNKVIAVHTLYQIFTSAESDAEYMDFLSIIKNAWGGCPDSWRKEIMNGVWLFMRAYGSDYDERLLVKKLMRVSPAAIIREAKVSTASGDRKYAVQILNAYNSNASKNRLPDLL